MSFQNLVQFGPLTSKNHWSAEDPKLEFQILQLYSTSRCNGSLAKFKENSTHDISPRPYPKFYRVKKVQN